jgi:hypothetical protein
MTSVDIDNLQVLPIAHQRNVVEVMQRGILYDWLVEQIRREEEAENILQTGDERGDIEMEDKNGNEGENEN